QVGHFFDDCGRGGTPIAMQNARYAAHFSRAIVLEFRRALEPAPFDFIDVLPAPLDQSTQAVIKIDLGGETDLFASAFRRTDPISYQRRLAPGSVVYRLIAAGQFDQPFGHLLQRCALPSPDVVEAIGRRRLHRADV